ncbi:MAG: DUF4281 domain-containing protein [Kangiellaceae bacterium]|nr:DUF4281 domain-containing protein [Kangiellaceae bacterium]
MITLSNIFKIANYSALLGWGILIILPSWQLGQSLVIGIIVTLLSIVYCYLVFLGKKHDDPSVKYRGNIRIFEGVINLFKSPRVVLAGWIHYLAFDLMVGIYILNDASQYAISHWLLIPCLLLTLMFGPAGLLLYFSVRFFFSSDYELSSLASF